MTEPETRTLVPLADGALQLKCSVHRALTLLLTGKIDGNRVGRQWMVSRESVADFIARRRSVR